MTGRILFAVVTAATLCACGDARDDAGNMDVLCDLQGRAYTQTPATVPFAVWLNRKQAGDHFCRRLKENPNGLNKST